MTSPDIRAILTSVKTIALVGASANPARDSHHVMATLQGKGYRVIPVNPGLAGQTLQGETVAASLDEIEQPIDMVDIFRASEHVPPVVEAAIALKAKVIWMQLGVIHEEAAAKARAAGLQVVMDRCPAIEIRKLGL